MKRIVSIAIVLLMLAAFTACGKAADVKTGTWEGSVDITAKMTEMLQGTELAVLGSYLKNCTVNIEVKFDDKEATIKYHTEAMEDAFVDAVKQYLADQGVSLSDADVNDLASGFSEGMRQKLSEMTERYTLSGNKITINKVSGTVSGDTMKLTFEELGEVTFTRK